MTRAEKIPDQHHPIVITPTAGSVRVVAGGSTIADSTAALTLQEASYPPVQYVPLTDVDPAALARTGTTTYCPYKGDASYYSLSTPEGTLDDAAWFYAEPYDAVAEIAGFVAFYPGKVSVTVEA